MRYLHDNVPRLCRLCSAGNEGQENIPDIIHGPGFDDERNRLLNDTMGLIQALLNLKSRYVC